MCITYLSHLERRFLLLDAGDALALRQLQQHRLDEGFQLRGQTVG